MDILEAVMDWNKYTLNPRVLLGYFDSAPSLQHVQLHRVSLSRDGPVAEIVFDVGEFPQKPSPRWPAGANTCQITLHAIGLEEVELTQWGTGISGTIDVRRVEGGVEISFTGEGKFRFRCSQLAVSSVSGYIEGAH